MYRPYVNAGIATGFSAAAFRFGHSQIPRRQTYIGPKFEKRKGVPIEKTFHKPYYLQRSKHFGYEGILRWLITDEIPVTDRYAKPLLLTKHLWPKSHYFRPVPPLKLLHRCFPNFHSCVTFVNNYTRNVWKYCVSAGKSRDKLKKISRRRHFP